MIVTFAQVKDHVSKYKIAEKETRYLVEDKLWNWVTAHNNYSSNYEFMKYCGYKGLPPISFEVGLENFESILLPHVLDLEAQNNGHQNQLAYNQ
jgi:hypothetical protein